MIFLLVRKERSGQIASAGLKTGGEERMDALLRVLPISFPLPPASGGTTPRPHVTAPANDSPDR